MDLPQQFRNFLALDYFKILRVCGTRADGLEIPSLHLDDFSLCPHLLKAEGLLGQRHFCHLLGDGTCDFLFSMETRAGNS